MEGRKREGKTGRGGDGPGRLEGQSEGQRGKEGFGERKGRHGERGGEAGGGGLNQSAVGAYRAACSNTLKFVP